jgi:hypothetical protein
MSIKMNKIMEQVNAVARSYVQVQYDFENNLNAIAHTEEVDKLRAMIEDSMKVPDGWKLVPVICTPGIESVYANDTGAYQTAQELHDAMLSAVPSYEVTK